MIGWVTLHRGPLWLDAKHPDGKQAWSVSHDTPFISLYVALIIPSVENTVYDVVKIKPKRVCIDKESFKA